MRAFVAIDLPPLEGPVPTEFRPEDHLTLHFFAEIPTTQLPAAVEAMSEAAGGVAPFPLEIRGVGAFPDLRRPRVVWAGVGTGAPEVETLATRLRSALSAHRFPTEPRPFVPHLTLARIRSARDAAGAHRVLADPQWANRLWVRTTASEILLKESVLLPSGARHTVRHRVPLGHPSGP